VSTSTQVCALPGCQTLTEKRAGRPPRRYCCAAHRKAARAPEGAPPLPVEPAQPTVPVAESTPAADGSATNGSAASPIGAGQDRPGSALGAATAAATRAAVASTTPRQPRVGQYRRLVPEPKGERSARRRRLRRLAALEFVVGTGSDRRVYAGSLGSDPAPAGGESHSDSAASARTIAGITRAGLAAPLTGFARLAELDARLIAAARSGFASVLTRTDSPGEQARPAETANPPVQAHPHLPDGPRSEGLRREAKRRAKIRVRQAEAREREFLLEEQVPLAGYAHEALRAAVHSLVTNRLRSFLTTAGIIIGIAAVIVLVALGNGMKAHFNEQFSRLANQITITSVEGTGTGGTVPRDLTDQDVTALRDPSLAPDVASVSPSVTGTVTLSADQNTDRASLVGATDNYLDLVDRKIVAGSWLTPKRGSASERQAVLGPQAVALLWGPTANPQDVVGDSVRIDRTTFKVAGVLETNGQNDNVVITPFDTARTYLVGNIGGRVDQIVIKSSGVDTIDRATGEIVEILDYRHRVKSVGDRDYNVLTFTTLLAKSTQFINFLTMFIVAIAAISLLVGGIGVANIMLISVTERTREIGIRKAVGATRRAILRQFLSEAVMLTGLGGVVGVALGVGLTLAGGLVLPPAGSPDASDTNFPAPILSAWSVVIAFVVSLVIGVLAGGYPAYRAARMRPIDALRFE
jgi:ABC-type antimicrobial peptide transport system permease subunit